MGKTKDTACFLYHTQEQKNVELFNGMIFGRSKDADYMVRDDLVSSRHFRVRIDEGHVSLVDLKSQNKTKLNEKDLDSNRRYILDENDRITIGGQIFIFTTKEEASFKEILESGPDSNDLYNTFEFGDAGSEKKISVDSSRRKTNSPKLAGEGTYVLEVKKNRQLMRQLEKSLELVEQKISRYEHLQSEGGHLDDQIISLEKLLKKTHLKNESEAKKEVENFENAIEGLNSKIADAEKIIEKCRKEMFLLGPHLKETEMFSEAFTDLSLSQKKRIDMGLESEKLMAEELPEMRGKILRDIRKENFRMRELQSNQGMKVNRKKVIKKSIIDKKR